MFELKINGEVLRGFEAFTVTKSLEAISGTFEFTSSGTWAPKASDRCQVLFGDHVIIDGAVDETTHAYDAGTNTFSASGRDLSADAVDCSAVLGTGQLFNVSLEDVAQRLLNPFSIDVVTEVSTAPKFVNVTIDDGESIFEVIERMARHRGVILQYVNGTLFITQPSQQVMSVPLMGGQNIASASLSINHAARYHTYIIKSQTPTTPQWDMTQAIAAPVGKVTDPAIRKTRTKVMMAETAASAGECVTRAQWQRNMAEARGTTLEVTVQGIEARPGELWQVNRLVHVQDDTLNIDEPLLIAEITYALDAESGLSTTMTLKKRQAYTRLAEPESKQTQGGF